MGQIATFNDKYSVSQLTVSLLDWYDSTCCCTCVFIQTAGATGTTTTKIFPAPTRPLKTKRDPKKLRMAGGQVWEDHSLDDWDQSELNMLISIACCG